MVAVHPHRSPEVQTLDELERRRVHIQAHIDAADIETTTPAQLNEWLATRRLLDRLIGRQIQARILPERNAQ
jgi:hypothetical protein